MTRRMGRAVLVLMTGMAAGILTTACGDGSVPPTDDARTFTGQIDDYDGNPGALRVTARVFDDTFGSKLVIGEGNLESDGSFDFALEADPDPRALVDFQSDAAFCAGPTVSGAAHGGSVRALELYGDEDARLGRIGLASSRSALNGALDGDQTEGRVIARMYADAPVTIEGDCDDAFASYDLRLDAGWNLVEIRADGSPLEVRSIEDVPPEARWWFRPDGDTVAFDVESVRARNAVVPWLH